MNGNVFVKCAFERTECNEFEFVSSRELHYNEVTDLTAKNCLSQEETEKISIGQCASDMDQNGCTSVKEACQFPEAFVPASPLCTIHDHTDSQSYYKGNAHYGSCLHRDTTSGVSRNRCYWSQEDCFSEVEEVSWSTAFYGNPTKPNDCTCDLVRTGACKFQNELHCAVSDQSCDRRSHWVPASDLTIDCRLCSKTVVPTPVPTIQMVSAIGVDRTIPGDLKAAPAPTPKVLLFRETKPTKGGPSQQQSIALLAGIFGAGLVAVLLVVLITNRNKPRRAAAEEQKTTVVTQEAAAINDGSGDLEDVPLPEMT